MQRSSLISILLASLCLLFLHIAGLKFYLYWQFSWYDFVIHFIAGFLVVMITFYLAQYHKKTIESPARIVTLSFLMIIVIGILWEVFEYSIGATLTATYPLYVEDTVLDLFCDISGAVLALLYYLRLR